MVHRRLKTALSVYHLSVTIVAHVGSHNSATHAASPKRDPAMRRKPISFNRMPILTSKTRAQGASIVTTLPAEAVRRLGLRAGQELEWIEDGMGGFRVVPHTPELAEALEVHERIMAEYDAAFRALAK
jgi:antitoxin component of MazEF toxin-antitoxin module